VRVVYNFSRRTFASGAEVDYEGQGVDAPFKSGSILLTGGSLHRRSGRERVPWLLDDTPVNLL
jgi:hypothetical protein